MDALYRLYAKILNERLRKELEEKSLLSDTQFGCRNGRGAMEAVWVINWLLDRRGKGREMGRSI